MLLNTFQANFYLFELFQINGQNNAGFIQYYFLEYSKHSPLLSHQLIWQCKVDEKSTPNDDKLFDEHQHKRTQAIYLKIEVMKNFNHQERQIFNEINEFLLKLTQISSILQLGMSSEEKIKTIEKCSMEIKIPEIAYLPTNPQMRIYKIDYKSGRPLRSAAKNPFMLTFYCEEVDDMDKLLRDLSLKIKKEEIEQQSQINKKQISKISSRMLKQIPQDIEMFNSKHKQQTMQSEFIVNKQFKEFEEIKGKLFHSMKNDKKIDINEYIRVQKNNSELQKFITEKEKTLSNIHTSLLQNSILKKKEQKQSQIDDKLQRVSFIFKTHDDVRHDTLTLKFIQLMDQIYKKEGLDIFLQPYNTFSNRVGEDHSLGGIIEVLKDASSIADIGKKADMQLYEYYKNKFGLQVNK